MSARPLVRDRYSFGNLEEVLPLPHLIDIQRKSFKWFRREGIGDTFSDLSPITDFSETLSLELEFDPKDEDLSFIDPNDINIVKMGGPYLKNQTIFANMKYSVTKQFGWGLEVINFTTTMAEEGGTSDLTGQRFTGSWWYIF